MVQTETDKTLAKKREILRAASEEFRRKGFHDTGMRDIARRVGVTVGNLYYYFKNKGDLLAFCQEDALRRLTDLAEWARSDGADAATVLYRMLAGHVLALNEATPGSLAHLELASREDGSGEALAEARDAYEARYRELVVDGIEDGLFRRVEVGVAARSLLGAVNWTVRWFHPEGRSSAAEVGAQIAEQSLRGLLADADSYRTPHIDWRALRCALEAHDPVSSQTDDAHE